MASTIASVVTEVRVSPELTANDARLRFDLDDDDLDRNSQRRRYEEPLHVKVRKQLLGIAESVCTLECLQIEYRSDCHQPVKKTEDEIQSIAKTVVESHEDEELRSTFINLSLQL